MSSYAVYLRIRHPSIDPAELTRALHLEPLYAWAAGTAREAVGAGPGRVHGETYWLAQLPGPQTLSQDLAGMVPPWATPGARADVEVSPARTLTVPLEGFLSSQLRRLQPSEALLGSLREEGGTCEICLTLAPSGGSALELSPALLRAIAALHLTLSIEVGEEDEESDDN